MKRIFFFGIMAGMTMMAVLFGGCQKDNITPIPQVDIVDTTITIDTIVTDEGCLPGLFSVSETSQVRFSQGNLQWSSQGYHAVRGSRNALPGSWRFAEHQYDVVGSPSQYETSTSSYFVYPGNVEGSDNGSIGEDYAGWIDLFGWGTSGYRDRHPYSVSVDASDYGDGASDISGTYYDWGVYNAISNGGDIPGIWRTLTSDEWYYLLNRRTSAHFKHGPGSIQLEDNSTVNGWILLPDVWELPDGCTFTDGQFLMYNNFDLNTYTLSQWAAMEAAGAVFLPAAGSRNGAVVSFIGGHGDYWSSTYVDANFVHYLNFWSNDAYMDRSSRTYGRAVRLAREIVE